MSTTDPANLLRTSQALDGDLSSVFRQQYARPSTEYWGVFSPTEEERRSGFGRLPPHRGTTRSAENSSSLVASSLSHDLPGSSQGNPPCGLQTVPFSGLERGESNLAVQRQFSFDRFSWRMNSGDAAADFGIPSQVPGNPPLPVSPSQADHFEAGMPLKAGNSLELERRMKLLRAGADVQFRGFCSESAHRPTWVVEEGVQAMAGCPVANAMHGGQQLLQQYNQEPHCNDLAEGKAVETGTEQCFTTLGVEERHLSSATDAGLQLVLLLLACAEAVDNLQFSLVHVYLMRLRVLVEPRSSTMQRLAAIFVTALTARVTRTAEGGLYMGYEKNGAVSASESLKYFSAAYDYTPLGKLPHVALNQIILDVVEKESCVHIIDLNTEWRGMQWPAFIHALATRPGATPRLRITALGRAADLAHAQKKLHMFAENLLFPLEFCPLAVDLKDFDVRMLDIREGEAICINSFSTLHQFLAVGDSRVHKLFCDLNSLNPRVFAISDNDTDHNSVSFLPRFVECLKYYSAVFDAFDASIPDRQTLLGIEQLVAGQKIRNIIACEGHARIERHETMASWNRRMLAAGFQRCRIGARVVNQASILLTMYYADDFTLSTKEGYVALGWKNVPLMGIAAWCTNCETTS